MPDLSQYKELPIAEDAPAQSSVSPSQRAKPTRLSEIGYWALVALIFMLPFELTQKPFFSSEALVLNNLKVLQYLVAGLAALSLARPFFAFMGGLLKGQTDRTSFFYRQRFALALFMALLVAALLSSGLAKEAAMKGEGLKWTAQLLVGGLTSLGVALWLTGVSERKFNLLGLVLVLGGVIAGVVGFFEFIGGMEFADSLSGWFKLKPTVAGPFLRLSGTFEYANIAAMYFELALPFAISGLLIELARPGARRWWAVAGWASAIIILIEALLLTLSRGAWLGLGLGLVAMAVVTRNRYQPGISRRRWWIGLGLTGLIGLIITGLTLALIPQVSLRLNSQSDQEWYRAVYQSAPPAVMTVCQELSLPVTVENQSPLTWIASGSQPYNLSYHWLYPSGQIAQFDGIRTPLATDVSPGGSQSVQATLRAPKQPGQYLLVWDMVQEEVSWFSLKSTNYNQLAIQVNDLPPNEKETACSLTPTETATQRRPVPKELPKVLNQPSRDELWKVALKMVAARPLLGVGPHSFRLSYGAYVSPQLADWDKRIFANNLTLEILADLGLVGGGLFFSLLVALGWPIVLALWRGQAVAPWQVALSGALVAFFGHGLLDYILGSHAINILFWVLFGMAASRFEKLEIRHQRLETEIRR